MIRLQNIGDGRFIDERAHISLEHFESLRSHEAIEGDLILASLGTDLPRVCIVPHLGVPAIVKADCIRVRVHPSIDPRWLLYALSAPQSRTFATGLLRGVGRPRLGLHGLRRVPIPIPPLAEQRRIVESLEAQRTLLNHGIHLLRGCLNRTQSAKVAILQSGISGRYRYSGKGANTPPTWDLVELGSIAEIVGGLTKDSKRQSEAGLVEVPYLRVANVQRGRLDLSQVATIRVTPDKARKLALLPGDVLLNEGGDRDKLGRGWVWSGEIRDCIHQNHVFRVRLRPGTVHPKLLSWYANTAGSKWFEAHGKQTTNLASVSLSTVKRLPVPVPPIEEQESIVQEIERQLSALGRLDREVEGSLTLANSLSRSLLKEAFAGRLVPQDPSDEPASVLLKRIRAEREQAPKPKWGRRTPAPAQAELGMEL